jgi:type II secretory ATPase GspE/PulE/Tfp pilus assembly ATPase PilB-like protein
MGEKENSKEPGHILLAQGKITEKQLELAQRRQQRLKIQQHRAIVELNYASEEDTYRALAEIHHMEFHDLSKSRPSKELLERIPVKLIFHYRIAPVALERGILTIAFSELPRQMEEANLRLVLGSPIKVALATPSAIHALIKNHFGLGAATIQKLRDKRSLTDSDEEIVFEVSESDEDSEVDTTISDFVDQILLEALKLQATDIHLEPYHDLIRLRYRIDGLMQTIPVPTDLRRLYGTIVSRLKIMAGLDIAEKRLPMDGRIAMKMDNENYDLRISTIPTSHGEGICLRILGRESMFLDLGQLGMESRQEELSTEITNLPQGLVLLTGPTGSGKTTTLYAMLAHANEEGRKIITIEDPVEYQLDGISQIQVREDIGMTFAGGLRSILRHDPDVLLIGEIRDDETASIAVRAAQTGHLVFSTIHTNDSISAISRLLEMRVEPFLVGSSLVCSIAQRLARRICRHCWQKDVAVHENLRQEMAEAMGIKVEETSISIGPGCVECNQKGYRGRVGIYEFFIMNEEIAEQIAPGVKTVRLRQIARSYGWSSLREQGWQKVQRGLIPISEQQRLTHQINPRAFLEK